MVGIKQVRKLKVLFTSFQSNRSGATRVLLHILRYLNRTQFEPHVLFNYDGPIVQEFQSLAPTYLPPRLPGLYWLPLYSRMRQRWQTWWFYYLIHIIDPDLIYCNTVGQTSFSALALQLQIPKVIHFHEIDTNVMRLEETWLRMLQSAPDIYIGCSQANSAFIVRYLGVPSNKVHTVYAGLDVSGAPSVPGSSSNSIRKSLGVAKDAILISSVGKPSFLKGTDIFIEVAALLRKRHPDLDLHFVWVGGTSEYHKTVFVESMYRLTRELGLTDRMHWITELPDVSEYLEASDVYVVSSREESLPLGMLEAMLMRTPVVGFAINGIPEALNDDTGVLVYDRSPQALANGISYLAENSELRQSLVERAREFVTSQFDIAKNISTLEMILLKAGGWSE